MLHPDTCVQEAMTAAARGEFDAADSKLKQALTLYRRAKDKRGQTLCLTQLGNVFVRRGDLAQARVYYQRALKGWRALKDVGGEAKCVGGLGVVNQELGNYARAHTLHQKAYQLFQSLDEGRGMANQIGNLANIARVAGDFDEALEKYGQALNLHRELQDTLGMSSDLGNMADVYRLLGDFSRARKYQSQALEIAQANNYSYPTAMGLGTLGLIAENQENLADARRYYDDALEIFQMVGDRVGEMATFINLGNVARKQGEFERAQQYYLSAIERSHRNKGLRDESLALAGLGLVYQKCDTSSALPYHHRAVRLAKQLGDSEIQWRILGGRGDTYRLLGRFSAAYRDYLEAIEQIEMVRSGLTAEPQRIGFVSEERQAPYIGVVKLLTRPKFYRVREALEMVERARSRAFLDLLLTGTQADRLTSVPEHVSRKTRTVVSYEKLKALLK